MIHKRILDIIEREYNGNRTSFGQKIGVAPNTVVGWISGNRNVGNNVINKILNALPEINPTWLFTGEGSMLKGEQEEIRTETISENTDLIEYLKEEMQRLRDELKEEREKCAQLREENAVLKNNTQSKKRQ